VLDGERKPATEVGKDIRRADPTNPRDIKDILDSAPSSVDDFLHAMRKDDHDDAVKGAAITEDLNALMGALDMDKLDLGDLLGTAGQLSSMLRGMITNAGDMARELGTSEKNVSDAAKAAIELDRILRRIEGLEPEVEPLPVMATLPMPPPGPPVSSVDESLFQKPSVSSQQAKSIEDIMSAVAYEIHQLAKNISAEGDMIAAALAELARAARAGDKQGMLIAAKKVSAHIIAFCKELNELGKRIPGKNMAEKREQDRLIRAATGLRTFGTQLKILCSVKAASIEVNRDNDESLASLTRTLGEYVQTGLTGIASVTATILPRK